MSPPTAASTRSRTPRWSPETFRPARPAPPASAQPGNAPTAMWHPRPCRPSYPIEYADRPIAIRIGCPALGERRTAGNGDAGGRAHSCLVGGSGTVKLVIAIVRPEKTNDVLEALYRAEVRGVSISRVQGHGGELDRVETYRGTRVQMGLEDKVRYEIAVSDDFVEPTINALVEGARTGDVGDGKIFVLPLERAVRIRTGETDHGAVTPVRS